MLKIEDPKDACNCILIVTIILLCVLVGILAVDNDKAQDKIETLEFHTRVYKNYYISTERMLDQIDRSVMDTVTVTEEGFKYLDSRYEVYVVCGVNHEDVNADEDSTREETEEISPEI